MRITGDTWHADELGFPRFKSDLRFPLSAVAAFAAAARSEVFVTSGGSRLARPLGVLLAICGLRRLVVLEFVAADGAGTWLWRVALRSARSVQVMSEWERNEYASRYKLPKTLFTHIPWPLQARPAEFAPRRVPRHGVVASGRNSCDWETLFEAARGQDWDLTVICGAGEVARVRLLAGRHGVNVDVRSDIPADEHFKVVCSAEVYVLPLQERNVSAGHIRLMTAITAGTPIVASEIRGIADYLPRVAVAVPPSDAAALRTTVNWLRENPREAERVSREASEAAKRSTWTDYVTSLDRLITGWGSLSSSAHPYTSRADSRPVQPETIRPSHRDR